MIIFVDGNQLSLGIPLIKEGRKMFLPLDPVIKAMGWTYNHEEGGSISLSFSSPGRKTTTYLHDEWGDGLRLIDDHIYIAARLLEMRTFAEIEYTSKTDKVIITTSQTPGVVTDPEVIAQIKSRLEQRQQPEPEESAIEAADLSPEESENINYGKYSPPVIFDALYSLDDQLQKEGLSLWDELGFYGGYYHSEYENTPWDVIVFGWTGGDGIHFGFLTDFGTVADLNEAPIVMVSPMGGDEAGEVVANNIREFLSIIAIDDSLIYYSFDNEEAYLVQQQQDEQSEWAPTEEEKARRRQIMDRMVEALNLPLIEQPYAYLGRVKAERANRIVVATHDGLGVTTVHPEDNGRQHEPLLVDDDLEAEELREYLARATYAGKLALIRDFNAKGFNSEDLEGIMVEEMVKFGFYDELARKNASAW
ncbi:hypothetical protein DNH61_00375 [Paenibacillus sambharensis]|uniref:Uncharacterized protein n=1 Tax=Paenibacillus sambharensis TaxID=1803190 RepID=A0A2W1LFD8_9BACL|nr:hypothetical protein [Paenibacillus sambharensis]PZD97756.1 hypothetical protein DNH61_00375 [Paenibacillus sambharensis]